MAAQNLQGQRFGRLTVLERDLSRVDRRTYWLVRCECGTQKSVAAYYLTHGKIQSCGCLARERASMSKLKDLTGGRFGRLLVLGRDLERPAGERVAWLARCDCGRSVSVKGGQLISGKTRSCGCLKQQMHTTHGRSRTPEYDVWIAMNQRCYNASNPEYKNYGARGITVEQAWQDSFEAFYGAMGPRPSPVHSLDRIDNDGGYETGNCRWATPLEQGNNRRATRRLTYDGRTMSIAAWSRATGIPYVTLMRRLALNWPIEKALTEAVREY